jgi:chromosomal replication initiator protein
MSTISPKECKTVWDDCLEIIKDNVDAKAYETWFQPIIPIAIEKNTLILQLPSHLFYEWIETHYVHLLKMVIKRKLGTSGKLQYRVVMEKSRTPSHSKIIKLPSYDLPAIENPPISAPIDIYAENSVIPNPFILPGIRKHRINSNLIESLTFDNYVEGECNRLARSAGWAISGNPGGTAFNPLYIHSEVGLGKTHLSHAIGNQTKVNFPDKVVLYVNTDQFYQQYIEAVKNQTINDFIFFYQSIDVLIIDDIQFMAGGKQRTQEAFFQILNHILQKSKQIIITSDKSPVDMSGFEHRVLSRFKWGLAAELHVPDLETRIAIMHKMLENEGTEFPVEVIDYMALRITSNTRELKGAMIAILAQASLNKKDITVELAKEMIDKYVKSNAKEISVEYIQKVISDYFGLPAESINANTRKREMVLARQLGMYFSKKYKKIPYSTIGTYFGNRDHATVLYACRSIENLIETDKKVRLYVEEIDKKMKI